MDIDELKIRHKKLTSEIDQHQRAYDSHIAVTSALDAYKLGVEAGKSDNLEVSHLIEETTKYLGDKLKRLDEQLHPSGQKSRQFLLHGN